MTRIALALAATLLAGAAPAAAQPATYHAVGTEPFWSVTITPQRMRLEAPGQRTVTVATPRAQHPAYFGRNYRTGRLDVMIRRAPCSDGMSDRTYEDSVTVRVGGGTLRGCGGAYRETQAVNLVNTNWRIAAIDGREVTGERYHLEFTDARVSGRAGCNSFGGSYRLEGNRLFAGPLMSTRMACLGGTAMQDERFVTRLLAGPTTVRQPSEQVLELRGTAGSIRLQMVPGARPRN